MFENKRRSGRTSRMLVAVAEYLIKNPKAQVVQIVSATDAHAMCLHTQASQILSTALMDRIMFATLKEGNTKEQTFYDHFTLECELEQVNKEIGALQLQLYTLGVRQRQLQGQVVEYDA